MNNLPNLIFKLKGLSKDKLKISIIVPVFNQELRILRNIKSILECLSLPHELIVIDDASNDNTLAELKNGLPQVISLSKYCKKIVLWHFDRPNFETLCDSKGIFLSKADYILEIQADMIIYEYGFDKKMLKAMQAYPDLLMLSGRGTEKIESFYNRYKLSLGSDRSSGKTYVGHIFKRILGRYKKYLTFFKKNLNKTKSYSSPIFNKSHINQIFPNQKVFFKTGKAGRLSSDIEMDFSFKKNKIWLSETVMRGPLLIDKKKYCEVGSFDINKFFQGYDDHDLALRGWVAGNYRSGFIPIRFISPLEDGTTRKEKTLRQEIEIFKNLLKIKKTWKKSTLFNYRELIKSKPMIYEIREF